MNAARLACNVLHLSGPLRSTPFAFTPVMFRVRYAHQKKKLSQKEAKKEVRKPTNQDIPHMVVQVANEDGKLESPEALADLLARVDLTKSYVELMSPTKPVVKIFNKKEERVKAKAREKARKIRLRANEEKEIQMTWGVAPGDLAHKLDKARKELEKQTLVDLVFAPKSKQPIPPPDIREEKVAEVLEILKDVGRERMPRSFRKSLLTIYLRGIEQR